MFTQNFIEQVQSILSADFVAQKEKLLVLQSKKIPSVWMCLAIAKPFQKEPKLPGALLCEVKHGENVFYIFWGAHHLLNALNKKFGGKVILGKTLVVSNCSDEWPQYVCKEEHLPSYETIIRQIEDCF